MGKEIGYCKLWFFWDDHSPIKSIFVQAVCSLKVLDLGLPGCFLDWSPHRSESPASQFLQLSGHVSLVFSVTLMFWAAEPKQRVSVEFEENVFNRKGNHFQNLQHHQCILLKVRWTNPIATTALPYWAPGLEATGTRCATSGITACHVQQILTGKVTETWHLYISFLHHFRSSYLSFHPSYWDTALASPGASTLQRPMTTAMPDFCAVGVARISDSIFNVWYDVHLDHMSTSDKTTIYIRMYGIHICNDSLHCL